MWRPVKWIWICSTSVSTNIMINISPLSWVWEWYGLLSLRFRLLDVLERRTRQAVYVWRNIEARSCNLCCRGKTISITYSECVSVALVIKYAERMGRNILPCVVCPAVQYVSTLYCKLHDFRKKEVLNIKCVLFSLQLSCETCLVLRRIQRDIVISVQTLQLEFSRQIF
jgi:hypothetical protein